MQKDPKNRIKVLFLPKWYPHRYDPMPGLFVQRQAEAVSLHCDVSVLYVHEDLRADKKYEVSISLENNIRVARIYYKGFTAIPGYIGKLVRICRFLQANWLGFRNLRDFSPDLLHVHVLTRLGLIALIYKIFTGIPYVITEHWSRYFSQNDSYKGFLRKYITGNVIHFASAVIPVSGKLKQAMLVNNFKNRNFRIIHNPVDMKKFRIMGNMKSDEPVKKKILHISCFEDRSKNISGFLRVVKQLSLKRDDFECYLVGDGPDREQMILLAKDLDLLDKFVFFTGLKEQADLVKEINSDDFLVLSSHYETFGSVVIESLACGIPVVATDVGVVSDVVNERNGMIVPPGNETALEAAIDKMLGNCRQYDNLKIRESVADRFDNKFIGEQLYYLYLEVLNKNPERINNYT